MSDTIIVGDESGVNLWNRMTSSQDAEEAAYLNGLNAAAQKYGVVWFSDCVAQRKLGANQTMYQMTWDPNNLKWNITVFQRPDPTPIRRNKI